RDAFHAAMLPLLERLEALPHSPVHLDYHSRNLMLPDDGLPLGVIDFQDAVTGPVTYDPASLLYDCYQHYSENIRSHQSQLFFEQLPLGVRSAFESFEAWHEAVRLTAMQRHIKAIGIFARLAYRDGKRHFLDEIPLTRIHLNEEMAALALNAPGLSLLGIEPHESRSSSL
ncbi:MAG TPA: phosphotransferase, partial [Mariprofundaceae bacterium]|nr:phosphotransferase [Mariprofundaceae bacterium]